jgi:ABC-type branched-subunit amino acid transport system permease subunit
MPNVKPPARRVTTYKIVQGVIGIVFAGYLIWRLFVVFISNPSYGPDTWARFAIAGLILGSVYALVAIGYTLVYGILRMINFAHGDIMMIGAFGGYFVFEALKSIPTPTLADPGLTFLNAHPTLSVIAAFIVGVTIAALSPVWCLLFQQLAPPFFWKTPPNCSLAHKGETMPIRLC